MIFEKKEKGNKIIIKYKYKYIKQQLKENVFVLCVIPEQTKYKIFLKTIDQRSELLEIIKVKKTEFLLKE